MYCHGSVLISMRIGLHISIAGGIDLAVDRALARRCDTFQIFTRNPRGWRFSELADRAKAFRAKVADSKIEPIIVHMPYLPNLASPRRGVYEASVRSLLAEVKRCELLGARYLVVHLGSHLGSGAMAGSERVVQAISEALLGGGTTILLENTAGSRNSMGSTFDEISNILDKVGKAVNVCLDTCHAFASGYDLRDEAAIDGTLCEFDGRIGMRRLRVIHANDSKGALGSRLDRHEHIGLGRIGIRGFRSFLTHPKVRGIPLILETPVDRRRDDYGNVMAVRRLGRIA